MRHICRIFSNLCGQDYADWKAKASEPGGEIEKKREQYCGGSCPVILKGDSVGCSGAYKEDKCNSETGSFTNTVDGCNLCEGDYTGTIKFKISGQTANGYAETDVGGSLNCADVYDPYCLCGTPECDCCWHAKKYFYKCDVQIENKLVQAAANTEKWFTTPITIRLPTTLNANQSKDGSGHGYKNLSVEKDPDSDSDATGVELCVTKTEYMDGEEPKTSTSKMSLKFGGQIGDVFAHAKLTRYSCEKTGKIETCINNKGETEEIEVEKMTGSVGADARVEWSIAVIQCTYD